MCFIYTIDVGSPRDSILSVLVIRALSRLKGQNGYRIVQLQPNSVLVDLIEWITRSPIRPDSPGHIIRNPKTEPKKPKPKRDRKLQKPERFLYF